jgi:hypothetical protein
MEEKASCCVEKVLDVEQELPLGLFDIVRPIEQLSDLCKRQDSHHERVIPELIVVFGEVGDVLHAAEGCSGQFVHCPLGPRVQPWQICVLAGLLVEVGEREKDGHGVDVFGGAGLELFAEPVLDDLQDILRAVEFIILPEAVETNAMRPSRELCQRLFRALFCMFPTPSLASLWCRSLFHLPKASRIRQSHL